MEKNCLVPADELRRSREIGQRLYDELKDRGLTFFIESYGCQMNDHDSEKIAGLLKTMGFERAEEKHSADLIIFNTCCVREHAELRVFGNIGALKKLKDERPGLIIGVCGCMMQQQETAARLYRRFPYVDMVFGTNELHRLPDMLQRVLSGDRVYEVRQMDGEIAEGLPALRNGGFSANVTIMYGCDNFCSYCIVPYVRGRERSRASELILEEVRGLAREGYKEVTLLGQNVNSYHGDGGSMDFPSLLRLLNDQSGMERIRFMTSHPKDLSDGLIQAMSSLERVCNHIHLPVQSGSDAILRAMNRRYTQGDYLRLVEKLRDRVPGLELTTDIIVGFPGETEEDFRQTLELVDAVGFSAAFTFMYSPRQGTKAAAMPDQVPEEVKKQRLQALNELQAKKIRLGNEKYVGTRGRVLVEGCDNRQTPMAFGKLTNFKMVYFPGEEGLIGTFADVAITAIQNNSLNGELIKKEENK